MERLNCAPIAETNEGERLKDEDKESEFRKRKEDNIKGVNKLQKEGARERAAT